MTIIPYFMPHKCLHICQHILLFKHCKLHLAYHMKDVVVFVYLLQDKTKEKAFLESIDQQLQDNEDVSLTDAVSRKPVYLYVFPR